jgi:hypothetical protein
MNAELLKTIAADNLGLAAGHHLAVAVIGAIFWIRRASMERIVDVYFAAAFATTAFALSSVAASRPAAVIATGLAVLWIRDAILLRTRYDFRRAPRARLTVMAVAALFAIVYPGYSGELPSFIFSPLGVLLPPTILLALALVNCASPATDRVLHWALAGSGLLAGAVGLAVEGPIHVPLLVVSVYAVPLLLGKGKQVVREPDAGSDSVRQMRDRMYARKTLLPGPREPRRRRFNVRGRKR